MQIDQRISEAQKTQIYKHAGCHVNVLENFSFKLKESDSNLLISLMDYDVTSKDDVLGIVLINLEEIKTSRYLYLPQICCTTSGQN